MHGKNNLPLKEINLVKEQKGKQLRGEIGVEASKDSIFLFS